MYALVLLAFLVNLLPPLVVTTLHPKIAFLDQIPRAELPDDFVNDIEHWKTRSGVVKINLALAELPNFTADPSSGQAEHHTGSVEMAPTMDYIEAAFQDARAGKPALMPFSDGVIPTTLDKTLNPDGTHIMSLFTQWVPADWANEPHTEELDAYADRLIELLRPGGARLQILDHPIATSSARTRWSRSTASSAATFSTANCRWSSCSTCDPRPVSRTTAHRSPACTTAVRPPMRAAGSAVFPAGRRPEPPWPTRSAAAVGCFRRWAGDPDRPPGRGGGHAQCPVGGRGGRQCAPRHVRRPDGHRGAERFRTCASGQSAL